MDRQPSPTSSNTMLTPGFDPSPQRASAGLWMAHLMDIYRRNIRMKVITNFKNLHIFEKLTQNCENAFLAF